MPDFNVINQETGERYYQIPIVDRGIPGMEHIYQDGHTEFVANPAPVTVVSSSPQPTTPSPAPVAPAPAPPPAAPAPAPAPSSPSTPPSTTTTIPEPILAGVQEIEQEIKSMSSTGSPEQTLLTGGQITQQIQQLQNQIYDAAGSGPGVINQPELQSLEGQTVTLGVQSIEKEAAALQQEGGVSSADVQTLQQQYDVLQQNVKMMEERGGLPSDNGNINGAMTSLQNQINAMTTTSTSSSGGTTPPQTPLGSQSGSGSSSSGSSGSTNNNDGSTSSSSSPGATSTGDGSTPSQLGSTASAAPSSSGDDSTTSSGSTPAPVASGATYTVVSGDTMWGIAQSNNIPLSQLEAQNPQIQNPELILPGQTINVGGGVDTATSNPAAPPSGATYTVVHGDTLSGIAASNGMTTSQIEALNPQIKDPDLIFPGQNVNLGGGSTGASSDSSQPSPVVAAPSTSTGASDSSNSGINGSSDTSSGGGAIGFPDKSSYSNIGSEAAKADDITLGEKAAAAGWADSSGGATSDIAKSVFEVDNHTSTDPLKIDEKK